MSRKEIVYLSGTQILIIMIIIGNALVVGFFMRWHSYQVFRQEDRDLETFTLAQRKERAIKEEIRTLEGKKTWNMTDYAIKNEWSKSEETESKEILDLLK